MKRNRGGIRILLPIALVLGASAAAVMASDDERGEYGERGERGETRVYGGYGADAVLPSGAFMAEPGGSSRRGVAPVANELYREDCGGCHFAYQPGLLPARSWDRMLGGLADHFGENAELPGDEVKVLRDYLMDNAADASDYRRSRKIAGSIMPEEAPLRISATPYFVRKHDELPRRVVQDNPDVRSFSNCNACHSRAEAGSYREDEIRIPGYGRWDDD